MFACILRTEYRNALSRKESLFTNLRSVLRNARDLTGQRGQLDESDSVFQTLYSMLSRQTYSSQAFGTGVERLFSWHESAYTCWGAGISFNNVCLESSPRLILVLEAGWTCFFAPRKDGGVAYGRQPRWSWPSPDANPLAILIRRREVQQNPLRDIINMNRYAHTTQPCARLHLILAALLVPRIWVIALRSPAIPISHIYPAWTPIPEVQSPLHTHNDRFQRIVQKSIKLQKLAPCVEWVPPCIIVSSNPELAAVLWEQFSQHGVPWEKCERFSLLLCGLSRHVGHGGTQRRPGRRAWEAETTAVE